MTDLIEDWPTEELSEKLLLSKKDGIAIVTINEPERRNPMPVERWEAFAQLHDTLDADTSVRVVVWTGAGNKVFASGADSRQFDALRSDALAQRAYEDRLTSSRLRLKKFSKPVIACIQGYCVGGGLSIAMHADICVCSEGSRLGIPTAKIGFALSTDSMTNLLALLGPSRTRMLTYTGRLFNGHQAEQMGLVDLCVEDDALSQTVLDMAKEIAGNAPLAVRAAKITINELLKSPTDRDLPSIAAAQDACANSQDYREGRTALREKRPPQFIGK